MKRQTRKENLVEEMRETPRQLSSPDFGSPKKVWKLLCEKEESLPRDPNAFQRHPKLTHSMRSILLDWLMEVCHEQKLHRETFHLSVDYLDRYLLVGKSKIEPSQLQLIGSTALVVAMKMEEIYPPKIACIADLTDGSCTDEQIRGMEEVLLDALDWKCTPITAVHWLGLYLQLMSTTEIAPEFTNQNVLKRRSSQNQQQNISPCSSTTTTGRNCSGNIGVPKQAVYLAAAAAGTAASKQKQNRCYASGAHNISYQHQLGGRCLKSLTNVGERFVTSGHHPSHHHHYRHHQPQKTTTMDSHLEAEEDEDANGYADDDDDDDVSVLDMSGRNFDHYAGNGYGFEASENKENLIINDFAMNTSGSVGADEDNCHFIVGDEMNASLSTSALLELSYVGYNSISDGHVYADQRCTVPKLMRDEFIRLAAILDIIVLDSASLQYKYSELAAAVVWCCYEPESLVQEVTGFRREYLADALNYVELFVRLCERIEPAGISIPSYSDVAADDSHNIQTYVPNALQHLEAVQRQKAEIQKQNSERRKLAAFRSRKRKICDVNAAKC